MIEVTPLVVVGVAAAAFTIGFVKAGIGGSIGPLATILVVLVLPVQVALGVLLPLLMVGDALALAALWRRWDLAAVGRLLPGATAGVAGGTYLLAQADSPLLTRLLGILMLLFVAYWVVAPRLRRLGSYRSRPWPRHHAVVGPATPPAADAPTAGAGTPTPAGRDLIVVAAQNTSELISVLVDPASGAGEVVSRLPFPVPPACVLVS
jgi:uncharacterized membrane protein YfcA